MHQTRLSINFNRTVSRLLKWFGLSYWILDRFGFCDVSKEQSNRKRCDWRQPKTNRKFKKEK